MFFSHSYFNIYPIVSTSRLPTQTPFKAQHTQLQSSHHLYTSQILD